MATVSFLGRGKLAAKPNSPVRVVGMDLGTTNSTIAEVRWEPGGTTPKVRCVGVEQPTLEGTYTHVLFPSVVAIRGARRPGRTPRPCRSQFRPCCFSLGGTHEQR